MDLVTLHAPAGRFSVRQPDDGSRTRLWVDVDHDGRGVRAELDLEDVQLLHRVLGDWLVRQP